MLLEGSYPLVLAEAGGYRVEPGQSNEHLVLDAAVVAFVIKSEDLTQTYFLPIIKGDVGSKRVGNEAVIPVG